MASGQELEAASALSKQSTRPWHDLPLLISEQKEGKPRKARASKPKVRTGCMTCKIRRVKCDERKPTCFRCEKFCIKCDGYIDLSSVPERRTVRRVSMVPRISASLQPLSTTKFDTSEEYQYFLHYRNETTIDLSGAMPDDAWSKIIPCASESQKALRQLTLAVSAMDISRDASSPGPHLQFALAKYDQALRGIRELITSRADMETVRISLIASLLIFCFENLQGNHESATRHIQSAIKFMRTHLTSKIRWDPGRQALSSVRGIEDEVAQLLVHMDAVSVVTEFMAGYRLLHVEFMEWEIDMPSEFHNIREVIGYLQQWQVRIGPYIPRLRAVWAGLDDSDSEVPRGPPHYFEKLIQYARQWFAACKPLMSKEDPTSRTWLRYAILHAYGLATIITVTRAYHGNSPDKPGLFEPDCLAIIKLCTLIFQNPYYRRTFAFDMGPLESLFDVCMICPKKEICDEAIRLLKLAKGRTEMLGNAETYAAQCEGILQMRFPASMEGHSV